MSISRACLLTLLALTFHSNAYASSDILHCRRYLNAPLSSLSELKAKLPEVPAKSREYFADRFKEMGLPKFYRLKFQPHFYNWTLQDAIEMAESTLRWNAKEASFENARAALVFSGHLPLLISNARNSWTEYVAYANDGRFTAKQIDEISDSLFSASVVLNIYITCLAQKL